MVELAWLWLQYQPDSALSLWFLERVGDLKGRVRHIAISRSPVTPGGAMALSRDWSGPDWRRVQGALTRLSPALNKSSKQEE
jgi:hypothetical protein